MVDTPGAACHIDSHREDDPRVDGGPVDASEVPLSGVSGFAGLIGGKVLAGIVVAVLGIGAFVGDILIHAAGILGVAAFALALNAYQHRALSEDESTGE